MKETTKIIKALGKANNDNILVKTKDGSSITRCKRLQGTTMIVAKSTLYYLLTDLSVDLHLSIDKDKLRNEIFNG